MSALSTIGFLPAAWSLLARRPQTEAVPSAHAPPCRATSQHVRRQNRLVARWGRAWPPPWGRPRGRRSWVGSGMSLPGQDHDLRWSSSEEGLGEWWAGSEMGAGCSERWRVHLRDTWAHTHTLKHTALKTDSSAWQRIQTLGLAWGREDHLVHLPHPWVIVFGSKSGNCIFSSLSRRFLISIVFQPPSLYVWEIRIGKYA